jgi:hypothetical protein
MVSGSDGPVPRFRQCLSLLWRKRDDRLVSLNLCIAFAVLFESEARAKVADFGLAKILVIGTSTTRSLVGLSMAKLFSF